MENLSGDDYKKLFYSTMVVREYYRGSYKGEFSLAWDDIDDLKFKDALVKFEKLSDNNDIDSTVNAAVLYEGYEPIEDMEKANLLYESASKKGSAKAISYIAEKSIYSGDYDRAYKFFESILSDKYYGYYGYYGLACIYENGTGAEQNLNKAIDFMKEATNKEPLYYLSPGKSYMMLGLYYYLTGDDEKEEEALRKSFSINIDNLYTVHDFFVDRDPERASYWEVLITGEEPKNHDDANNNNHSGKGGCFIATSVYGDYESPKVKRLRVFRNEVLLKNDSGKKIVEIYYKYSPLIASFLDRNPICKLPLKHLILNPIIKLLPK